MSNIVYVVHCIDTEGPLYESIEATFERINDIFDFDFEVSKKTLLKLQNKEIDLDGDEEAVYNLVAPNRLNTNETWDQIDAMLDNITTKKFREKHIDSFGNGWIYNWFCMDHVGFTGVNPRRRDIGYHNIFDHYNLYNNLNDINCDLIQWHYHPLAIVKDAHRSGTTCLNSANITKILARKIIDRAWFPAAFRPGFHTERPDLHWFLEQWIPFDYANQSKKNKNNDQPDLNEARFGDWRKAPISWIPYNPDFYDYQKKGDCNRYIARCLNMDARLRELEVKEIKEAFNEAKEKGKSLLSFTNHDFRNMEFEINKVYKMIKEVDQNYSDVKFKYVNAINGMREVLDIDSMSLPNFEIELSKGLNKSVFKVKANNTIFGPQPFLAIKTKSNQYYWENFDFYDEKSWRYTFDYNNLKIEAIDKLGIAANTKYGNTEVVVLDVDSGEVEKNILNN